MDHHILKRSVANDDIADDTMTGKHAGSNWDKDIKSKGRNLKADAVRKEKVKHSKSSVNLNSVLRQVKDLEKIIFELRKEVTIQLNSVKNSISVLRNQVTSNLQVK